MADLVEIGKRLTSERERLTLNAVDVYKHPSINIAQTTYKNYEMGKRDIPTSLLVALWDIGFDVMYIVTGVRSEEADGELDLDQHFPVRLVQLPEVMDLTNPADALLIAMYHAEEALIQAGAIAREDYDYQDLASAATAIVDRVK